MWVVRFICWPHQTYRKRSQDLLERRLIRFRATLVAAERRRVFFLTTNETLISLIATVRRQSLNTTHTRFRDNLSLSLLVISEVDKEIIHAGMLDVIKTLMTDVRLLKMLLCQVIHGKTLGASFAEVIYGLQRVPLHGVVSKLPRLPPRQEAMSLLCLCVVPYLRAKLEDRVTKCQLLGPPRGWVQVLLRLHSAIHFLWETSVLGNCLYYMSGRAASHSPLLRLAGVTLKYAVEQEQDVRFPLLSAKFVGYLLTCTLEFGAFFLQFLQYWHMGDQQRTSLTALPVPPPFEGLAEATQYGGLCPICLQNWKIETALSVSGFVFCYRCIAQYLQENHCCPVTKYPADMGDLIRIYSSNS